MNQAQHKPNGGLASIPITPAFAQARELETLLTVHQVAGVLQVSPGWVRDHAGRKQPHLKCVRVGDLLRFRQKDVAEFIEKWCQ